MGDFNCKIERRVNEEKYVGKHGLGIRNHRGHMLANFLENETLYNANTFFQKKDNKKWTWRSPDGYTKNQIDYKLSKHL